MNNLFVYGTLKQNFHNHHYLNNTKCLGIYCTQPNFDLFPISNEGRFPVMIQGSFKILGEVYQVSKHTLDLCDHLEGHPSFYNRQVIKLLDGPLCFAYIFPSHPIDWKTTKPVESQYGIKEYKGQKEWILR